jgi:autotransporter-associated beta strand protein
MKTRTFPLLAVILMALSPLRSATADTIYSNLRNISIPTGFTGVYLDIDTGVTGGSTFTGWDINPFFGGVAIGNSPAFQPVRVGTGNLDRVLNLAPGSVISGSLIYSSGFGGSGNIGHEHIGAGADQFQVGAEGYLGFKFTTNTSTGPFYGWMRVTLTNNTAGAMIKDWGYDDAGGTIAVGRVQQSEALLGMQTVTLSPGSGETFTLGSAITDSGGNTNSVLKTGAGTTILTAATNTYTGGTSVVAGTLLVNNTTGSATGSGAVVVSSGATLGGTGIISGAATIHAGGIHSAGTSVTAATPAATLGKETFTTGINYEEGSIFEWNLTANTDTTIGTRGVNYDAVNTAALTTSGTKAIFRVVLNGTQNFSEDFWNTNRTWSDIFTNVAGDTGYDIASIFRSTAEYWNSGGAVTGVPLAQGSFTITGSTLTWTAVPEPASGITGLLIAAGLLRRRRALDLD